VQEKKDDQIEVRVRRLEMDMQDMAIDIQAIMRNHLPHIQVQIAGLTTSLKIYGGLILAGITALIILGLTP